MAAQSSVYIKIVRLIRYVGDRVYAMSRVAEACTQRLVAGRDTGIGLQYISLQHVNDDQSTQRDKPRWV